MTNALYLVADLAGSRVAIESGLVESVVHVPEIVPAPMSDPSIAGIFALRSRVLTLIDTQYLITGIQQRPEKGALSVVTEIAGHQYGLLVDKVHDRRVIAALFHDVTIPLNQIFHQLSAFHLGTLMVAIRALDTAFFNESLASTPNIN